MTGRDTIGYYLLDLKSYESVVDFCLPKLVIKHYCTQIKSAKELILEVFIFSTKQVAFQHFFVINCHLN